MLYIDTNKQEKKNIKKVSLHLANDIGAWIPKRVNDVFDFCLATRLLV